MSEATPPPPPAADANPDCPHIPDYSQCRVAVTKTIQQPVIDWTPIYDGHGTMTNSDPNVFISTYSCTTCSMSWEASSAAGKATTIRSLTNLKETPPPC